MNLKSNTNLIYVKGVVNDPPFLGSCDNADNRWGEVDLAVDLCLDAKTLAEKDKEDCETAGLAELTIEAYTHVDAAEWDAQGLAKKLAQSGGVPKGIRSFTGSKLPTGEEGE